MPIANTECIKYYKSGMATLFHSYNPIKTNSGCWLCNKVQTWWSTSAEGVHAGGAAGGKPREELRVDKQQKKWSLIKVIIEDALHKNGQRISYPGLYGREEDTAILKPEKLCAERWIWFSHWLLKDLGITTSLWKSVAESVYL